MATTPARTTKARRINLRATDRQETLIRTGARTHGVSLTDFILESACLRAEHVLADKSEFSASSKQWKAFLDALDRPARVIPELARLLSGRSPRALPRRTRRAQKMKSGELS